MTEPYGRLCTEAENPRTRGLESLPTAELVARIVEEDAAVQRACAAAADDLARLVDLVACAMRAGGRMVYVGAGTSGRLAQLDAVELGPTFGIDAARVPVLLAGGRDAMFAAREGAEDDEAAGAHGVEELGVGPNDVVVGVSASGRTPFVIAALAAARARGAVTGAVVCNPVAPDFPADVIVHLATGPEVLAGSTRMKAGSATKMALNALSLSVMVRLGKVYGNRMVDLRVGSRKLADRARRLVVELGRVDPARAERLLAESGGHAKLAILMARASLSAGDARQRLEGAGGSLAAALGEPGP